MSGVKRRGSPEAEATPSSKRMASPPATVGPSGGGGQPSRLSPKTTPPQPPRSARPEPDEPACGGSQMSVHDVLYGPINFFEPIIKHIMDTAPFQRLRYLKQLGSAPLVYPGATHSRFEHCLGVAHRAEELCRNLRREQPGLGITHKDVLCVKIAGLCHDLGHGPFSHLFENFLRRVAAGMDDTNPVKQQLMDWTHEAMSVKMFDHILEIIKGKGIDCTAPENGGLMDQDIVFIKELVLGAPPDPNNKKGFARRTGRPADKAFLYDIVCNLDSGFDVDKLDYLQRDPQHALGDVSKSVERITSLARVCKVACPEGERRSYHAPDRDGYRRTICLPKKSVDDAMGVFGMRRHMHSVVYQHRVVMSGDEAVTRILALANDVVGICGDVGSESTLSIAESALDVHAFTNLTDGVLDVISNWPVAFVRSEEARERLVQAKKAIRDGRCVVGHFVDGLRMDGGAAEELFDRRGNERDIARLLAAYDESVPSSQQESEDEGALRPEDIIVLKRHIHYGAKGKNPLDQMNFFTKQDQAGDMRSGSCIASKVDCTQCCHNMPRSFEHKEIYILCEVGKDSPKWQALQQAVQHLSSDLRGATALSITSSQEE